MFSELPKLLDRDFAVGFFLPAAALCGATWVVLNVFGLTATLPNIETLTSAAISIFVVWLLSVALLALHYPILRFLEGYPRTLRRLLRLRERTWKYRFRNRIVPHLELQKTLNAARDEHRREPDLPDDFPIILSRAVENFPDQEEYVLPTQFGNTFRALEVYSRVVYGVDAIPAWPRLLAVLPEQFKKQLSEANSLLAFFVNLILVGVVSLFLYIMLAVWMRQAPGIWIPVVAAVLSIGAYRAAVVRARQYGTHVKSAFDLYRGELAKQLGLELPRSACQERKMWQAVNRMMIFRSSWAADQLTQYRPLHEPEKQK